MRLEDVWGAWAVDGVVPGGPPGRLFLDDHCPNCCMPLRREIAPLWCSLLCRTMAKDVRCSTVSCRDDRRDGPGRTPPCWFKYRRTRCSGTPSHRPIRDSDSPARNLTHTCSSCCSDIPNDLIAPPRRQRS